MQSYATRLESIRNITSRLKSRIDFLNKRSARFSNYRLAVFIAGLALTILSFYFSKEAGWIAMLLSLGAFAVTVHFHNKLLAGIRRCYGYQLIKEANIARAEIDWANIPEPVINTPALDMSVAKDLDLFGKYSFHHYCDQSLSFEGSSKLRKMISETIPAGKDEINEKQKIIKELSELSLFRDKFILKGKLISKKPLDCISIINWIKKSEASRLPGWLLPVSSILITAYILLFLANEFFSIGSFWILIFAVYFLIYSSFQKKISKITESASELDYNLEKVSALIGLIQKYKFTNSPSLKKFLDMFLGDSSNASEKLRKLQRNISALLLRENPVIRIIVNIVFPYDVFFCNRLIRVKDDVQHEIPSWLEKLNELECFISLANYAYINPDYAFPEIIENESNVFSMKSAGHPLIRRDVKVCNDFSFNEKKKKEVVIITGSNMSGKSTFLRTAGINLCLAYSGAPVNASSFQCSRYELFTCIKVNDSVVDGISYFYAEVKKLKELLDELGNNNGLKKFYLIDEIFKGTNNKERLSGSRAFIKKLSSLPGTGFITTHDLELVKLENEIPEIENFHFREEIENGQMIFDYKIHPGPCPTTNALRIMELSGLPVE